jgi:hypothetical protein
VGHVARMGDTRNEYTIFVGKLEESVWKKHEYVAWQH